MILPDSSLRIVVSGAALLDPILNKHDIICYSNLSALNHLVVETIACFCIPSFSHSYSLTLIYLFISSHFSSSSVRTKQKKNAKQIWEFHIFLETNHQKWKQIKKTKLGSGRNKERKYLKPKKQDQKITPSHSFSRNLSTNPLFIIRN